ncbi:dockerin type I repeat-containing protein [Ruminococcus sp.]|uniref:dockerin type I repeat-containing protein n=1 Tax=Ruminococcus sp. TaxID=41978 RepID=UPI0025CE72E7|nr:dockerin type I repeat-containing protein [Ruminococcus sp.]
MLFKKMLAVLSALTVIGSYSVYNSDPFTVSAENTVVSDTDPETCTVTVSMSSLTEPIPDDAHIKAKLVRSGEEDVVIDEWELTQNGVKELKGLEYSEDYTYKIIFEDVPEGYTLPKSTTVKLSQKGDTDKIIFCGRGAERADREERGMYDCIEVAASAITCSDIIIFMGDLFEGSIEEKYIVDDNGVRYCGVGGFILPDGHYTAYVIPREIYRYVKPNSEAAAAIIDFKGKRDKRINMDYFDRDFSKGFGFDVVNGETDTLLNFYVEPTPERCNACSADISIVDSETEEPVDGIKLALINERIFKESPIIWNSTDSNPMSFDKLLSLKNTYKVTPVNTSELYYIPDTSFKFTSEGQHKDIVIRARRKKNLDVPAVVLPDEAPVPIDDKHCAVTIGIMDNDRKPVEGAKARIYKKVGSKETELVSWNAEEEPVKTINDIEFDEDAKYYLAINGESDDYYRYSDIQLAFDKGGSVDRVVHPVYPTSMKSVKFQITTYKILNSYGIMNSNTGGKGIMVTDMQGYRYPCIPSQIYLPDGEYLLKTALNSNYRIVQPNTEMEWALNSLYPELQGTFTKYSEYYENGVKFTVKNGECDEEICFCAEEVPTSSNSCTADIKVVDEETEETVEGVTVIMNAPYRLGNISWNTSDTPVMNFDSLRLLKEDYCFKLTNIPEGYAYKYEEPKITFEKYGEHQDLVIKLSKTNQKGDANCDGNIDMADTVLIMQVLANPNKYGINGTDNNHITEQGTVNADVDTSAKGITGNDALKIQKYLLNLIDSLTQDE